jgi:hypothetical protein
MNWQANRRRALVAHRGADPAEAGYRSALDIRDLPTAQPGAGKSQAQLRREFYDRNGGVEIDRDREGEPRGAVGLVVDRNHDHPRDCPRPGPGTMPTGEFGRLAHSRRVHR